MPWEQEEASTSGPGKELFCPLVFLQCPVLAKLKIVPAGKGEMFQDHKQAKKAGLVPERQFIDNCYS